MTTATVTIKTNQDDSYTVEFNGSAYHSMPGEENGAFMQRVQDAIAADFKVAVNIEF